MVGGYTPEKVALRRAISLGYNDARRDRHHPQGPGDPGADAVQPRRGGLRPGFRTTAGEYSPAKAKALLDMFGYVDRDGDGYREMPDGQPRSTLRSNSTPTARDVQLDELWKRSMDDIGLRISGAQGAAGRTCSRSRTPAS